MKMPQAVYDDLKSDMLSVIKLLKRDMRLSGDVLNQPLDPNDPEYLTTIYSVFSRVCQNRSYNDTHPGFAGGHWQRMLPCTGRNLYYLYDLGLNDQQIELALIQILQELLPEMTQPCPIAEANHPTTTPRSPGGRGLPINTAPKDRYVILMGPSGYVTTPWRAETGRWSEDRKGWVTHANDWFTDGGAPPTHWMELPEFVDEMQNI